MLATTVRAIVGRPPTGPGHYLRDMVYGANDGVITTFAIVAGVAGANLPVRVALILGMANLVADGFSMAASNYLGLKSELHQTGRSVAEEMPWRHATATGVAFVVLGAVPLVAVVAAGYLDVPVFVSAVLLSAAALAAAGGLGALLAGRHAVIGSVEMVLIGGAAGAVAYGLGVVGALFI